MKGGWEGDDMMSSFLCINEERKSYVIDSETRKECSRGSKGALGHEGIGSEAVRWTWRRVPSIRCSILVVKGSSNNWDESALGRYSNSYNAIDNNKGSSGSSSGGGEGGN